MVTRREYISGPSEIRNKDTPNIVQHHISDHVETGCCVCCLLATDCLMTPGPAPALERQQTAAVTGPGAVVE